MIGLCGGSATGKTRFIRELRNYFDEKELCIISQDEYYKIQELQVADENGIINYDLPSAINHEAFAADLNALRSGKTLQKEEYTFNNPSVKPRLLTFHTAPVIIVEGIFIFHYPEVASLFDLKLFLQTRHDLQLARRMQRDTRERDYNENHVLYTQQHHIDPAYQ